MAHDEIRQGWAQFLGLDPSHACVGDLVALSAPLALAKGETLLREADVDTRVFLVTAGAMRAVRHTPDGQEVWFTDLRAGELIGEIAALTNQPRTSSVSALTAANVAAVSQTDFLKIARRHGDLGLAVARLLAARLAKTSTQVAELVAMSVQHRLHQELMRLSTLADNGQAVIQGDTPSVTQLGQRIHATREATSRALRDLELRGLIERSGDAWLLRTPAIVKDLL